MLTPVCIRLENRMGGGSSKDHVYLKRLLDQKEEEIQGLKKDLQRFKDEKLPEISEPTYPKGVQQAVRKSISKKGKLEVLYPCTNIRLLI